METKKILIVDDTPENIDILLGVLASYELYFAVNGESALQMVTEIKPDLILLDIMLPDINGFDVAKKIKQNLTTRDIPLIFITVRTDTESIVNGFELGASDYITKPFEPKEVLMRVKKELLISDLTSNLKFNNLRLEQVIEEKTNSIIKSEENFKTIINNSMVGIFKTSLIGEILYANKALLDIAGYNLNELTRLYSEQLYKNKDERKRLIRELAKNEKVENFHTVMTTKYGESRLVSIFAQKYDNFVTGHIFDITDKKEKELREFNKIKAKTIKNFSESIYSELAILQQFSLSNFSYITALFQDVKKYFSQIKKENSIFISEISDFSFFEKKIENQLEKNNLFLTSISDITNAIKEFSCDYLEKDFYDINKGLVAAVVLTKNKWENNANVLFNLEEKLPKVCCSMPMLCNVFYNVLLNSVQAICALNKNEEEWKGKIEITSYHKDGYAYIIIQNNGLKIDKSLTEKISNPVLLTQLNEKLECDLSEVYNIIVNEHQGSIALEADEKEGNSFIMCLPLNSKKEGVTNYNELYDVAE